MLLFKCVVVDVWTFWAISDLTWEISISLTLLLGMWKKQRFYKLRNVLWRRFRVYFLRFMKIEVNRQLYFVKWTFQSDSNNVKLILFAYFSCFQYWTTSIMMPNKRNFIRLTATPKATVNRVLLEARDISFPWNDVFDPQINEWLSVWPDLAGRSQSFWWAPWWQWRQF